MKHLYIITLLLFTLANSVFADNTIKEKDCTITVNGKTFKLYGKVEIVDENPDIKVQIVDNFADIKVQLVDNFPDKCGKVQIVDVFADVKVQIVDNFADIKVEIVDDFPGL